MNNLEWEFGKDGRTKALSVGGVDLLGTKAVKRASLVGEGGGMAVLTVEFIIRDVPDVADKPEDVALKIANMIEKNTGPLPAALERIYGLWRRTGAY